MYTGKLVFSQVMEHLPLHVFHQCVDRYNGNYKVKEFSCLEQYLCMAFAQLTYREKRLKIEASFTPSLLPSDALEALFVQKEDLAERIVELTCDSVATEAKYHFLLVGPRGIGKTHTVSLIYHRVKARYPNQNQLLISWLREDSWGIASFLDLLIQILQALQKEYVDEDLRLRTEELFTLSPKQAEQAAAALLAEYVGKRTLFLIVENLDGLFEGLGDMGQKRLRAYLQENPFCTILATSPSLFTGISLQTSPFYGFFSAHHLVEFDFNHALDFLTRIAKYKKDKHLTTFLRTPHGRARVRAVHHLAGGNPRVYTIFAQFLNSASMEKLVGGFVCTSLGVMKRRFSPSAS